MGRSISICTLYCARGLLEVQVDGGIKYNLGSGLHTGDGSYHAEKWEIWRMRVVYLNSSNPFLSLLYHFCPVITVLGEASFPVPLATLVPGFAPTYGTPSFTAFVVTTVFIHLGDIFVVFFSDGLETCPVEKPCLF